MENFCINAGVVSRQDMTLAEMTILADYHDGRTDFFPALDVYVNEILAEQEPVAIIKEPRDGMIVPAIGMIVSVIGMIVSVIGMNGLD